MTQRFSSVKASVGFASDAGPRKANEDFAGTVFGSELRRPRGDIVAAIADGIGGSKGGRVAAEIAVRGFLDGFCDLPESREVRHVGAQVLNALNGWIYFQSQRDPQLKGMGCTFTALILRGRRAHVLHVGDTRAYQLSANRVTCLTTDHVRAGGGGYRSNILSRALGVDTEVRLDYATQPMARHDRFLLCSDGVHGFLTSDAIADILRERSASDNCARALVTAALQSGSTDNCTALVLDVIDLPTAQSADMSVIANLPMIPVPVVGETADGFLLKALVSDGRYTRLFGAIDEVEGGDVVLKFPKPQAATAATYRTAFAHEAWVGARVDSPWVGRVLEIPAGRQTCLYTVMPLYQGELLETRLTRRLGLEEGRAIAIKLARGAAALHRAGIIHRDIKPDNVILEDGGSLKLLDLGTVRIPGLEDFPPEDIPGTLAYMAPEMLAGEPGNVATDIYALGVTMFRAFTGEFPYGNADAISPPRQSRPKSLSALRPDLPAWLQAALARAIALDPGERFNDMSEFAMEMETGPAGAPLPARRPLTLYERYPTRFWQGIAALFALGLALSLLRH